ncbi:ATP-binding protein, partial [Rhodococcus pyridinivorans]|uniref:ATP-binding protein n=1 Tax=Rhodococcus pyridinivorans TaxID=103816 RepID=UPI00342AA937
MTITPDTTTSTSLYQRLRGHLATLKLHDAAEALPSVLDRAQKDGLSMTAALEQLLSIEVDATEARRLAGRLRFACLPTPASLDDFDYDAAPGLDRALITELGTCRFLETATNVLLIGPPGVGMDRSRSGGHPEMSGEFPQDRGSGLWDLLVGAS